MWTNDKIQEASDEWLNSKDWTDLSPGILILIRAAFIQGCRYIINNTQKQ